MPASSIDTADQYAGELSESEAPFLTAFDSSPIGILIVKPDGRVLRANAAAVEISGYSEAELMGRTEAQSAYPQDVAVGAGLFADLLEGRRESYQIEKRYVRKNGVVFWARVTVSAVRGGGGKPRHLLIMLEDIDEQKRILATLQESEARFRAMFEHSPVGIGLLGLDRRIIDANPAMCAMLGRSRAELVGNTPAPFSHPDDYAESTRLYDQLLSGEIDHYVIERRYIHKDGGPFWAQVSMSTVRDLAGRPLYLVGLVSDIDEQKRVLATLQESEARFRAMFENSALGVVTLDLKTLTIRANPAAQAILDDRDLGRTLVDPYEFIHLRYREAERELFTELLNGQRESYGADRCYVLHPDREPRWAHVTYSVVRDAGGEPRYIVGMIEETTEQKKAEDGLRQSEARFRAMYDNAAVGMAMMSLDRKIISINQTAARMTGYSLEELFNTDPTRLSHPDDIQVGMEQFRQMVAGQIPGFQMEKRFVRKDGGVFWGRVSYSAVPGMDGLPASLVGIIEDVTEQRLANERLAVQEATYRRTLEERVESRTHELAEANRRLVEEIEQRERAEEALASKAAEEAVTAERTRLARDLHDAVTQTMFSASLIAEVLPDLWAMDPEEGRKSTEELRQLTRGALAEMRTLLLELRPSALLQARLGDLIRQLCEALIGRARLPIHLTVEGERQLPPEVQVAFYRIAQESLSNAAKYARATKIDVELFMSPAGVHFNICDNGVGFDPANTKPTSLGMRIMRERAEAVGAQLSISSQPGKGVCVEAEWIEKPDMVLSVFKR